MALVLHETHKFWAHVEESVGCRLDRGYDSVTSRHKIRFALRQWPKLLGGNTYIPRTRFRRT